MHINEFLDYIKYEKRGSAHTVLAYQNDLAGFKDFLTQNFQSEIIDANYQMIRSWIASMMEEGLTAKSVNRKISTLKSFYRFLIRKNQLKTSPMIRISAPKIPKRLPTFVEEKRMNNLLDNIHFNDDFEGLRDRLIIEIFYLTGMRLSELINISISDINNNAVKVLGKGNKYRIIPLSDSTIELIKCFEKNKKNNGIISENKFLFCKQSGNKLTPRFVYSRVKHYLSMVTSMDKKSPHVLRHTFATHLLNNGAEINAIKELLGHSSLAATQVYTHNSIEKLRNIYTQTHPLAG